MLDCLKFETPTNWRVEPIIRNCIPVDSVLARHADQAENISSRCLVALVRSDVSEEPVACITRAKRIRELGTTLAVTGRLNHSEKKASSQILYNLKMEATLPPETAVLTRSTRPHIPEDGILSPS
jgi:nitrate reductase beta subunit